MATGFSMHSSGGAASPAWRKRALAAASVVLGLAAGLAGASLPADDAATRTPVGVPEELHPPRFEPTRFPLDFVSDRTDLKGEADLAAYYGLLDYVRHVDPAALREVANEVLVERWRDSEFADWPQHDFPLYYDLTQRPEKYRGKPISLFGHLQLHHVDHPENPYGLDPVHIAYLYTDDSQHHPVRVVFTENPDHVPAGEQVTSGISVTGYFLKLYRYEDRDGQGRFMPLVLARAIRWTPPQPARFSTGSKIALSLLAVGLILAIVWVMRRARRNDAVARERERRLLGEDEPPDFASLT